MFAKLSEINQSLPRLRPPIWAKSGHAQTILGHLLSSPRINRGVDFVVELEGLEKLKGFYYPGTKDVMVYVFHGLGGSSEATYMHRTALLAQEHGFHVVIMNHRGCGEGVRLAERPYHSGRYKDISLTVLAGREKFPHFKHAVVGFSLSGNALLCLAGATEGLVKPDFAVAVNAPINLDRASILLNHGLNRIYSMRFLKDLRAHIMNNDPLNLHLVDRVRTLRDFDQKYTAPRGEFLSNLDYYERCSAKQFLKSIDIPTVMITAKDDPFVDYEDYLNAQTSKNAILHLEEVGGHMGYLGINAGHFYRWLDLALSKYLSVLSIN